MGQCSGPGRLRHPWPTQRFSLESVLQQWVVQLREVSIWVFINNSYQRGKWNSGDLNASHWLTVMAKELLQMSWIQIISTFWIKYFFLLNITTGNTFRGQWNSYWRTNLYDWSSDFQFFLNWCFRPSIINPFFSKIPLSSLIRILQPQAQTCQDCFDINKLS